MIGITELMILWIYMYLMDIKRNWSIDIHEVRRSQQLQVESSAASLPHNPGLLWYH
jgi:hypothetical protein